MRHLEDNLQIACMSYMRLVYPDVLAFHVPNGGNRSAREGARLKKMGVVAGVPDILILATGSDYHKGLAIELKVGSNSSSPDQKAMQLKFEIAGWRVEVVKSLDKFIEIVDEHLTKKQ